MTEAKKYLQSKCVVSQGDIVFMGLKELMEYTKLVQLESVLTFVEDNHPEAHGMMNSMKFQIREIKNNQEIEEKASKGNPFDE